MRKVDFSDSMPGRLVRTVDDGWAFAPDPLPPVLQWDIQLTSLLSKADRILGKLDGVGS